MDRCPGFLAAPTNVVLPRRWGTPRRALPDADCACFSVPPEGVRGPHGPPSGAEAGRSRRGGCEADMGHGAPRLKQGRSWGLSSGRAGVTAAIGAACKLAPHDHDQPAERCQRGQCGAASLNGGRNACAPTSTITPAPPVPRSRVQPDGHSLHQIFAARARAMASEIDQNTSRVQDASSASGRQQQHPRWQRRSAPAAAAAGAAETAAAAAVNAATAASSG